MATKAQSNTTLTWNSNSLAGFTPNIQYSMNGQSIDVTTLGDTGKVSISDSVEYQITADVIVTPTLDGYIAPYVGDGTKRTLVHTFTDGTTTVTNTWTSNAEIISYNRTHAVGAAHTGQVTFACSGAPTRTVA